MLIPEIILYNDLLRFQKLVRDDYTTATNKNNTILAALFGKDDNQNDLVIGNFNYFTQAVKLFTKTNEDSRYLEVNIGYNMERMGSPTIHILLPNENKGRFNSIGLSEGDPETTFDETNNILTTNKSHTVSSTYHLMITSDNSNEVLTLFYWMKAMFTMFSEHMAFEGLLNMSFSGADVNIQQDLTPPHIFHRNLSLSFDYQTITKINTPLTLVSKLKFMVCDDLADHVNS